MAVSLMSIDFLPKKIERPAKCPAPLVSTDKKRYDFLICEMEALIMEVYDHFSVLSRSCRST